jgi:hypothetical protein
VSSVAYPGMSLNISVRLQKQLHDGDNAAFRSIHERCVADLWTRHATCLKLIRVVGRVFVQYSNALPCSEH